MITTDPIGDWTWEVQTENAPPLRGAEYAATIWKILADLALATPTTASFSVRSSRDTRNVFMDVRDIPVGHEAQAGAQLSDVAGRAATHDGDVVVGIRIRCPGYWWESGVRHRAEQLFVIQVDIWKGALMAVTLETYSDAWLTLDTREREQRAVYEVNAPRLASALEGISALLGMKPTPGDANRYATPTETGFEDERAEGPAFADAWGTFEVPARSRRLREGLPSSEDEYEEITDHPVRYFTVRRDGQVVGYVWASVGDDAACFEPRTAVGDIAFETGRQWLLRLRKAHGRGLAPLAALDWLSHLPPEPETGEFSEDTPKESSTLDALEELSGRY
ncbi:hypothetical protein [Streptomyces mesophilus]|uniref:hypothetical protein n=1 Tax=Streptomyces mesophilus TaxID=1775132 RepID=UPI00332E835E